MSKLPQSATLLAIATATACALAQPASADNDWPLSLKPIGDGYPVAGAPCREVGKSQVTSDFLDDNALLVGCPGSRKNAVVKKFLNRNDGKVVSEVDGFTLISIPKEKPHPSTNSEAAEAPSSPRPSSDVVAASGDLRCSRQEGHARSRCHFAVIRKPGGRLTVKLTWPDGSERSVYFANGKVSGANLNQADAVAGARVSTVREIDAFIVSVGDEQYEIPDALVAAAQ